MAPLARTGIHVAVHPFLDEEAYATVRTRAVGPASLRHLARASRELRRTLASAPDFEVVWIQRGMAPFLDVAFLRSLTRRRVPVVYDFDDAVYLPQEGGRRWMEALRSPASTTRAFCRAATVVLAGNEHLAGFARSAVASTDVAKVRVLPSVVDTERFTPGAGPAGAPPTVGWVGSSTTLRYLEGLAPALRALRERVDHRLVVVAGADPPDLGGLPFTFEPWRPGAEVDAFHGLDVGLYPLDATPWSLGKCGFKAIQYLACEVPVVASPVGVLPDIVRPGETGMLAEGSEAWASSIGTLLTDPGLRSTLGRRGRGLVNERYSVAAVLPDLEAALRDAAARELPAGSPGRGRMP